MLTDGTVHLTTTFVGWHFYNVIWGLLVSTGLAIVPIAGMLLDHLVSARMRNSALEMNSDSVLAPVEADMFVMLMVILLAVQPTYSMSASSLTYKPEDTVYDPAPPADRKPGATDTNLDGALTATSADYSISGGSVRVPVFWYVVMQASQGIRHALVSNIDTGEDVYRAIRDVANRVAITDPGLKFAAEDFHAECYTRALSRYRRAADTKGFVAPGTTGPTGIDGEDISWIGSKVFQTEFYPKIRVRHPVNGFPYNAEVDTEFSNSQTYGAPLCSTYWKKIRDTIHAKAVAEGEVAILTRIQNIATGIFTLNIRGPDFKDEVSRAYLKNTEMKVSLTADTIGALRTRDAGWVEGVVRKAGGLLQSYELAKIASGVELGVAALVHMLIFGQAYALMIVYLSIPLVMLFSRYSIGAVASLMIVIFMLHFLPVLWTLVAWLDNRGGLAIYQGESMFGTLIELDAEAIKARIIHSIAIGALYIGASGLFTLLIALSGVRGGYALGGIGRSLPLGAGGATVSPVAPGSAVRAGESAAARGIGHRAGAAATSASARVRGR